MVNKLNNHADDFQLKVETLNLHQTLNNSHEHIEKDTRFKFIKLDVSRFDGENEMAIESFKQNFKKKTVTVKKYVNMTSKAYQP